MDHDGTLEQAGDRWQLRFVRHLPHPPDKVWRALVEPEHLDAWFPSRIDGERAVGAELRFVFDGHDMAFEGQMLVYDPPKVLEYSWGDDVLRFELEPDDDGDGTTLTFVDTFPELGKAARDAAGWHACLDLLVHHVAGEEPPWTSDDRWAEVHPGYVDRFPAEASTIGPPE